MAATEVAVPLLHGAPTLLLAGACFGVAAGVMPVTFATLVTRDASSRQFTAAMSVYNCAIDLGLFAGPLLGAAAARANVAAPFLLALPIGLLAVAMSPRAPRPRPAPAAAPGGQ
jgi:predicted MFS family arabinose efflux permease